jgi:nitrogenase molybdenum-iron protein beta chain
VVLSGCATDLVGDDIENVVTQYRRQGAPIVYAATGGFRGTNLHGHETIVNAIVDQLLTPQEKISGLVNVWSTVPYYDPFWAGNLTAIQDLLAGLGLRTNLLFGPDSDGIDSWRRVPAAELNLVVSSWTGLSTAKLLNERYGTPWLHWPTLPIGGEETSRFLRAVTEAAHVDGQATQAFLDRQERRYHYYFERAADFFLEFRWDLPSHYVTVTDAFYGTGISRLLSGEFGLLPLRHFVTDQPPLEQHEAIQCQFAALSSELNAPLTFTADGDQIAAELREHPDSAPLILGSAWERDIAAELSACHLSIASPMMDRLVASGSYFGYNGALRLIEDIYSMILSAVQ